MPKPSNPILLSPPQHSPDSVQTRIQILERGTEREPDEMVAGRVEEVSTVRRVDVEEDSWNHDRSLLQELFEECLLAVLRKRRRGFFFFKNKKRISVLVSGFGDWRKG